jgi:preprotein translocase subunit YajC
MTDRKTKMKIRIILSFIIIIFVGFLFAYFNSKNQPKETERHKKRYFNASQYS